MSDERSTLDHYFIGRKLGEGTFGKVKLCIDSSNQQQVAIKIIKESLESLREVVYRQCIAEVQALTQIRHPSILPILHSSECGQYYSRSKRTTFTRFYIVTEYLPHGDLFDLIRYSGRLREEVCRSLFRQLVAAVNACHQHGISHRDIKPENVLLDGGFNIRLADFGYSGSTCGKDGSGYMRTFCGTTNYAAPEVLLKLPYSGTAADVFSCGILLFIIATGTVPFSMASRKDRFFSALVNTNQSYWDKILRNNPWLTSDFQDLINGMLTYDFYRRLTLAQVSEHPWVKGAIADPQEQFEELKANYERAMNHPENPRNNRRVSGKISEEYKDDLGMSAGAPIAGLREWTSEIAAFTVFTTPMTADNAYRLVSSLLEKRGARVSLVPGKFKLKARLHLESEGDDETVEGEELSVAVELFVDPRDSSMILIEMSKQLGDKCKFFTFFDNFRDSFQCEESA